MFFLRKIFLTLLFIIYAFRVLAEDYKLNKIINLDVPWGISFINEFEVIITEKKGKIMLVNLSKFEVKEIPHNLNIISRGQGGLLDILYKEDKVWVSYSEDRGGSKTSTSIGIAEYKQDELKFKNIFQANPPINSGYHFGSRLVVKGNYLFASVGERGKGMIAQDPTKHPGSIIRIHIDGDIPHDNPKFSGFDNWLPEIYQIGVRNPQGLALSLDGSKVYVSNHGARGGDWFGEVIKGTNYGWEILGWGGTNYSGTSIGPKWKEGFKEAIYYWVPSIAISSIVIYEGKEFPEWTGNALITSLKDQSLRKLAFNDMDRIREDIIFKNEIGRIRDIKIHPKNGKIYLISDKALWMMEKNN